MSFLYGLVVAKVTIIKIDLQIIVGAFVNGFLYVRQRSHLEPDGEALDLNEELLLDSVRLVLEVTNLGVGVGAQFTELVLELDDPGKHLSRVYTSVIRCVFVGENACDSK